MYVYIQVFIVNVSIYIETKSMTVVRPHTSVLDIGSSLTLKCLYSEGHYNGKYLWFHEGKHLANQTDQYLNISNASLDDDGQYQCFTADLNIHTNGPSSHVYGNITLYTEVIFSTYCIDGYVWYSLAVEILADSSQNHQSAKIIYFPPKFHIIYGSKLWRSVMVHSRDLCKHMVGA